MGGFSFLHPYFLGLLLLIPLLAYWHSKKQLTQKATLRVSSLSGISKKNTWRTQLYKNMYWLPLVALALLSIALARPRSIDAQDVEGIDIVMAVDVSTSMMAADLQPNRLEALKKVAEKFVAERENDRIGLVVYAGEAFTRVPLTSDKKMLGEAIHALNFDRIVDDGTALGMGLTTAVNRLVKSTAKSKVIILLTDGENTTGFIEPETAAEIANENGIKVYTIGIGTNGFADYPTQNPITGEIVYQKVPVNIDEDLLKVIANKTNGKYFRAVNTEKLESIYNEINKLEKTKLEDFTPTSYIEQYRWFAIPALLLLLLWFVLKKTVLKGIV